MLPSHVFNMEFGHRDTFKLPDMEHPIESMPKLQRTEKRDILLEEETMSAWRRYFWILFLLLIGWPLFASHDMEHLRQLKPESERHFSSQSATKCDFFKIRWLHFAWQDMELLPRVNPKAERYFRSQSATKYRFVQLEKNREQKKPPPQMTTSRYTNLALIMALFVLSCGATKNTDCLTTQSVLLGSQGIIRCRLLENSTRFYWFDMNIEGDESLLIKLENGRVSGKGYTTSEFNIDSDGSLIINSVTVQHERVLHFESLSPNLITSTKDITVIVSVEPIEPIPVITECLGNPDCIMKGNLDGVISCFHHNTRPAATISWFMRDGTHDIPLNATTNQTLSADLITFSVTSEMTIGEIPVLVNMQSLVLLVCKSHNPYSVVQESDSKVLLDLSQNDPFEKQSNLPEDPVYAIQNQDLVIECPLTIAAEDSIVMWMAKSLETKNRRYLKYSAYGVPSVETDEQYSLQKSGAIVISQVALHHEGLYACIESTGSTTKSFLQRVEVIVQPTPPKVLVEGCNLFEPCSFHITETKAITCQVNGVYPEVELEIIVLSTNLAVINTKVSTYEDEGLFYTSIHGDVILVDASCQVNETIICQAVGPAANVFKSDAFISISSNGVKCPQISAAPFPADNKVQNNTWLIICLLIAVTLLYVHFAFKGIRKCFAKPNSHRHMQAVQVNELNNA